MRDRQRITPDQLRSMRWFAPDDLRSFGHRSRAKQMGYWREEFTGRPVIGIVNTWNGLSTCHTHFPERVKDVTRGIQEAGGFAVELPAMSLGEQFMKPTTMLYRNFLAMEVEEIIRCHPVDGVVLMGGCDKTTPALLMGALSANIPAIYGPAGPMLRGHWKNVTLGSGTDVWKYWADRRAGLISDKDWGELEDGMARSAGTCMTMGTAATMMSLAEAMGISLPGASAIPAVDASHPRMASASGRRIVEMVWEDMKPTDIMTEEAFENAIITDMAIGGSTNAIVHLLAMARRAGVALTMETFDRVAGGIPLLANIKPSGTFVMEDFYYAGGLRALLAQLAPRLHLNALTCTGGTLGEAIAGAEIYNPDVIRTLDNPVKGPGSTAVLRGSLAPDGAVIKQSAASPHLLKHRGRALVFDSPEAYHRVEADPELEVDEDTVLVIRYCGPKGYPGMPETANVPLPAKLLKRGVRDIVRICDGRMSGTAYGTVVLHVAPEAAAGGPLALVETGDWITLDVPSRTLALDVPDDELARRRAAWTPPPRPAVRGWTWLYTEHVQQADTGCDLDFLTGASGSQVGRESH